MESILIGQSWCTLISYMKYRVFGSIWKYVQMKWFSWRMCWRHKLLGVSGEMPPPPPKKKKKTWWKLITLQDHCQNLEEQFLNNYLMSLFCVISRKINILDITNIESKHTEHILSDWLILEILYCARNLRISHLSATDNWLICRYPQLTVAS